MHFRLSSILVAEAKEPYQDRLGCLWKIRKWVNTTLNSREHFCEFLFWLLFSLLENGYLMVNYELMKDHSPIIIELYFDILITEHRADFEDMMLLSNVSNMFICLITIQVVCRCYFFVCFITWVVVVKYLRNPTSCEFGHLNSRWCI